MFDLDTKKQNIIVKFFRLVCNDSEVALATYSVLKKSIPPFRLALDTAFNICEL